MGGKPCLGEPSASAACVRLRGVIYANNQMFVDAQENLKFLSHFHPKFVISRGSRKMANAVLEGEVEVRPPPVFATCWGEGCLSRVYCDVYYLRIATAAKSTSIPVLSKL